VSGVLGIDGCPAGWVVATHREGELHCEVIASLDELAYRLPVPPLVAIDIPIGLPDAGPRRCDIAARHRLGPRGSSVFPAPVRAVLDAADYAEANRVHRAVDGRGLSKQAWNLVPKIREAERLAQRSSEWRFRLREVHPELSFALMSGGAPLRFPKKSPEGQRVRQALLSRVFGKAAVAGILAARVRRAAQVDDLLDAMAALWSGERLLRGEALILGDPDARDATGWIAG
jgi:predicted RNase H-like nuclease